MAPGNADDPVLAESDVYLKYYSSVIGKLLDPLQEQDEVLHRDIVKLIHFVRDNKAEPLSALRQALSEQQDISLAAFGNSASRAIELAVRVWLMIDPSPWSDDKSLMDFAGTQFPHTGPQYVRGGQSTSLRFNMYRLDHDGDFDVIFTDDLSRHLNFDEQSRTLLVFGRAAFLRHYQNVKEWQVYPPGFLSETAWTISLLADDVDPDCRRWLRRTRKREDLDVELGHLSPAPRNLDQYIYWGTHLQKIQEGFDRAEPGTMRQWYRDKRFPVRRSNFWTVFIALVLTAIFGFIQSVTGLIQVIKG